jgi:hypothetical protein
MSRNRPLIAVVRVAGLCGLLVAVAVVALGSGQRR